MIKKIKVNFPRLKELEFKKEEANLRVHRLEQEIKEFKEAAAKAVQTRMSEIDDNIKENFQNTTIHNTRHYY